MQSDTVPIKTLKFIIQIKNFAPIQINLWVDVNSIIRNIFQDSSLFQGMVWHSKVWRLSCQLQVTFETIFLANHLIDERNKSNCKQVTTEKPKQQLCKKTKDIQTKLNSLTSWDLTMHYTVYRVTIDTRYVQCIYFQCEWTQLRAPLSQWGTV